MTFIEFVKNSANYYEHNKTEQRYGQALYNYLAKVRPDIAGQMIGTSVDPFHKTGSISDDVWTFISSRW